MVFKVVRLKKGESKLLSPSQPFLSRHVKLGALRDETKGRLMFKTYS